MLFGKKHGRHLSIKAVLWYHISVTQNTTEILYGRTEEIYFFEFSHFAPRTKQPETEAFLNSISGCFEGPFLQALFVIEKEDLWKISFMDKVGVPHTLRDVGIPVSDIEKSR